MLLPQPASHPCTTLLSGHSTAACAIIEYDMLCTNTCFCRRPSSAVLYSSQRFSHVHPLLPKEALYCSHNRHQVLCVVHVVPRREVELTDAFEDAPAAPSAADTQTSSSSTATAEAPSSSATTSTRSSSRRRTAAGFKSRKQRQADMAQAADAGGAPSSSSKAPEPEFKRCKQVRLAYSCAWAYLLID